MAISHWHSDMQTLPICPICIDTVNSQYPQIEYTLGGISKKGSHAYFLLQVFWVIVWYKHCSDVTIVTWCHNSTIRCHNSSTMATINRKYTWLSVLLLSPSGYSIWGTENSIYCQYAPFALTQWNPDITSMPLLHWHSEIQILPVCPFCTDTVNSRYYQYAPFALTVKSRYYQYAPFALTQWYTGLKYSI